jgi:hypothetical protein
MLLLSLLIACGSKSNADETTTESIGIKENTLDVPVVTVADTKTDKTKTSETVTETTSVKTEEEAVPETESTTEKTETEQ